MDQVDQEKRTIIEPPAAGTLASTASGGETVFANGTILADKYKVLSLIGQGGMGTVYRVEQIFMQHEYALKTLKADQMTDVVWRRFQKEAQAASRLNHPNLVRAYDFGLLGEGKPYFVMEFLNGQTLSQRIRGGGALGVEECLKIFIPVCFGLDYAHEQGIIHRDLKPSNVLLAETSNGEVEPKVVDFGIAKLAEELEATANALTKTGEIFGTPYYMSPEQCKGTKVDNRSDIYSLGCVLFEALTSSPPFQADSALTVITQHLTDRPPTLKAASLGMDFPPELERIVGKMLAKDPDERYQRMSQVARDLIAVSGGSVPATFGQEDEKPKVEKASRARVPWTATLCTLSLTLGMALGLAIGYNCFRTEAPKQDLPKAEMCPAFEVVTQFARVVQPYCNKAKVTKDGRWIFHFPDDETLGTLLVGPRAERKMMKGPVSVPAGSTLGCVLNILKTTRHPEILMRFNEDDLSALEFGGNVSLTANSQEFVDDLMVYVTRLQSLRSVNVDRCPMTDKGLFFLDKLVHLDRLLVRGTSISPQALVSFKRLPQLSLLVLDEIENVGPVLSKLAKGNRLDYLSLSRCKLNSKDIEEIAHMPTVGYLDIGYNKAIGDEDIKKLASLPRLGAMHINNTGVTARCLPILASFPRLHGVSVHPGQFKPEELKMLGPKIKIDYFGEPNDRPSLFGETSESTKRLHEFFEEDEKKATAESK